MKFPEHKPDAIQSGTINIFIISMRNNYFMSKAILGGFIPSNIEARPHKITVEEIIHPVKSVELFLKGNNLYDVYHIY